MHNNSVFVIQVKMSVLFIPEVFSVAGWIHGAVAGWKGPNLSQTPDLVPFYQQLRRVSEDRRVSSLINHHIYRGEEEKHQFP